MLLSKDLINLETQDRAIIESGWSRRVIENTSTYKITYLSDGFKVEGYMSEPEPIKSKLPLIVWNRGGFREDGKLDDFLATGILGEIASWGYIAMMSNYRDEDELGGNDINDVLNLIKLAEDFPQCDIERIGMEGWSRGGLMLYLTLTKTDKIKCAISVAGLVNLNRNRIKNDTLVKSIEDTIGSDDKSIEKQRILSRSATHFYKEINSKTPILFLHGTNDEKVNYKDSKELYELLKARNKNTNYELKLFEEDDHYLNKHKHEVSLIRKEWYDRYLKM